MTTDAMAAARAAAQHIVNVSGGKDSTACYLLAIAQRRTFRAVMADTGNEHPATIEHAATLHERTGGPRVEFFRADFTDRIARKAAYVVERWPQDGVPQAWVDRAVAALHPTGNPFLDLCLWKGRFPSRKAQFCTEFLKAEAIDQQVIASARAAGPVVQWLGVRRDESLNRRNAPLWQTVRTPGLHQMRYYRPLVDWTAQDVFALARYFGLPPNPLYLEGMSRVGCFPCINAGKSELRAIAVRFPEAFDRITEWEAVVAEASKRGAATFFAGDTTPEGRAMAASGVTGRRDGPQYPSARIVAGWATTDRGGRQMPFDFHPDDGVSCSSQYGLCE